MTAFSHIFREKLQVDTLMLQPCNHGQCDGIVYRLAWQLTIVSKDT